MSTAFPQLGLSRTISQHQTVNPLIQTLACLPIEVQGIRLLRELPAPKQASHGRGCLLDDRCGPGITVQSVNSDQCSLADGWRIIHGCTLFLPGPSRLTPSVAWRSLSLPAAP